MGSEERRILLVAPQPFYQDRGTPIAVRQVLEALGETGGRVDLLTYPIGEDVAMAHVRLMRAGNPFGVHTVPIGFSFRKVLLDAPLTAALAARVRGGAYTCIHAVEEAVFPAIVLGRAHRVPVLYDMQSSLPEHLQRRRLFRFPLIQRAVRAAERWALERADLVVCSAGLADRVRRLAPARRVREWHFPSAPAEPVREDRALLRRALELPADDPIVLYSGNFEAYQGIPNLLEAVSLVREQEPRATFLLVGAENGRTLAEYRARYRERTGVRLGRSTL
jgi:glycosyltransferase involved in cell wall biosynthesis